MQPTAIVDKQDLQHLAWVSFGQRRATPLTKPAVWIEHGAGEVASKVLALVPMAVGQSEFTAKNVEETNLSSRTFSPIS